MDIFRVFDSLNYVPNMVVGMEAVGKAGLALVDDLVDALVDALVDSFFFIIIVIILLLPIQQAMSISPSSLLTHDIQLFNRNLLILKIDNKSTFYME